MIIAYVMILNLLYLKQSSMEQEAMLPDFLEIDEIDLKINCYW